MRKVLVSLMLVAVAALAAQRAWGGKDKDVKVIPGHGALSNLDDVREFTKMLKETSAVVQKALAEHKTRSR
jgi:hypothetical protein